ncbi:MAG: GNAT family N-acetyltransferase [Clostridia bacterium]|nr:GNAT family N-acetyltransferase [Clostridia bacterium]
MKMKTKRLTIRLLSPDDWKSMQTIAADFAASEYAVYDRPLPTEDNEIRELTGRFAATQLFFAVLLDDSMIGYVCFHEEDGRFDLGYCFHSAFHGQGFAREACAALMEHIAQNHRVEAFTAGTALENKPSCRLLEKLGFTLEGTERLAFNQDAEGRDIEFEGGNFIRKG